MWTSETSGTTVADRVPGNRDAYGSVSVRRTVFLSALWALAPPPAADAQACLSPVGSATVATRGIGAGIEWGEGYQTLDVWLVRGLGRKWFGVPTGGFTRSSAGHSGPLVGLDIGRAGITPLAGLSVCAFAGVRHDHGFESATDFRWGLRASYPGGRRAFSVGLLGIYQRYSLQKDIFAKGQEWFGVVDVGYAVAITNRSFLTPSIRVFLGYGWGRRPSLMLRWTRPSIRPDL